MKHSVLIFTILCLLTVISCEKEYEIPEYDTWPVSADIFVVDKDGNNLIDPEFPGNILDENITMIHEGEVYERLDYCEPFAGDPDIPDVETKALPPAKFRGLQTVHHVMNHGYNSKHYLVIGYYEPDENFDWKEFVIDWGGTAALM